MIQIYEINFLLICQYSDMPCMLGSHASLLDEEPALQVSVLSFSLFLLTDGFLYCRFPRDCRRSWINWPSR